MNVKSLILLFAAISIFTSCSEGNKKETENSEVHFVLEGTVKNGNGKELALHIPSKNLDNRLISRIENGKFKFQGKISKPEVAIISFEDEHINEDNSMSIYQVFLTNDTTEIAADVVERHGDLFLQNDTILKGKVNQYFQSAREDFYDAYSGARIYGDSVKQDSMRRTVYPEIRRNSLKKYDELFSAPEHSLIALYFLRFIMEDEYIFNVKDLNRSEKTKLTENFKNISPSLEGTPDYTVVASLIRRMNNPESFKGFKDFALPDEKNVEQELSEIIKKNNYTVLDFWWAGCRPCRVFNRESQEYYPDLRKAGIEIIGINVDDGREQWVKASKSDSIQWINLYAGANSKIQSDYNVTAFPTKVVVDRDLNIVDIQFKTAKELLTLLSQQ